MNQQLGSELYHVTDIGNLPAILHDGLKTRAGSWLEVAWKPRVFFTTTKLGAYEMANNFMWERKGNYIIVRVDPSKVRGKLRPDRDYDQGVWTARDVPPEAILGVDDLDEDFFESLEFRAYMGGDDEDEAGLAA
jgi:RNA:NAD 2'-phosphotransferase (TPT1/KptA family)